MWVNVMYVQLVYEILMNIFFITVIRTVKLNAMVRLMKPTFWTMVYQYVFYYTITIL